MRCGLTTLLITLILSKTWGLEVSHRARLFRPSQLLTANFAKMPKRSNSDDDGVKPVKKVKAPDVTGPPIIKPPFKSSRVDNTRARLMTDRRKVSNIPDGGCVVYWMSRDQRAVDNHALLYAQDIAQSKNVPLKVVFNLYTTPNHAWGTWRAYGFMLRGLKEVNKI